MTYQEIKTPTLYIVGMKVEMSFQTMREDTERLAKQCMPRLHEVQNRVDDFTVSLNDYNAFDYMKLTPGGLFEKWIGVEVSQFDNVPDGMVTLTIEPATYLAIEFKGSMAEYVENWHYLHGIWLPQNQYQVDSRPHFEKLNSNYHPKNIINEEIIWIPVVAST